MNGIWKNGTQTWRLPDSAGNADDPSSPNAASDKKNAEPSFEIDFSSSDQDTAKIEAYIPSADNEQIIQNIPSLPANGLSANPDAIVMLDDPLPVSFAANVDVQEQFVAEVMRTALDVGESSPVGEPQLTVVARVDQPAPNLQAPLSSGQDGLTIIVSGAMSSNDDKTQITDQSLAEKAEGLASGADDRTIPSYPLAQSQPVETPPSLSVDFSNPVLSNSPPIEMQPVSPPQSPEPSAKTLPGPAPAAPAAPSAAAAPAGKSGAATSDSEKTKVKKADSGTKAGDSKNNKDEKTKAGGGTKAGAANKDKPAAGGKKSADGNTKTTETAITNAGTNSVSPPALGKSSGLRRDTQALIVVGVISMFAFAFVMFKKIDKHKATQQMSTEIGATATPDAGNSSVSPRKDKKPKGNPEEAKQKNPETNIAVKGDSVKSAAKKQSPAKTAALNLKSSAEIPDDPNDKGSEKALQDGELDLTFLLTKPVSRYGEGNRSLAPLIEVSNALDRVQPRRVVSLLRNLPKSFASSDGNQKAALQELTGRYYMQVGAYQKALLLFRQSCADPAKTSEVEICLHAARSYALMGMYDSSHEIAQGLSLRMTGIYSQWREWLKLIEIANQFKNPSVEVMIRFIDEMSDKGPFMTREWNLQLSTLFARIFLSAKENVRRDVLKNIAGTRKKTIEVRMAPEKYGQDVGSYMMPAFLNMMLRHHEFPQLSVVGDEPSIDSELSLTSWIFNVISLARSNEPRETRARLAPLFAERGFSALARLIEGQLSAQAGDYIGAHAMILEQIGPTLSQVSSASANPGQIEQVNEFISSTQRLRTMPFLFVEWLFLGVKVSAGLNDKDSLRTYIVALENARRRYPELSQEFQYWVILGRAHRVLGQVDKVEKSTAQAEKLAETLHDRGFIVADQVWVMMQRGERQKAKELMKRKLREIPHHARLLEVAAEFSSTWNEEPSIYLRLEAEIPQRYQTRGRDSVLLSFFTVRKLLSYF